MEKRNPKHTTVDAYISSAPPDIQETLNHIRQIVLNNAPEAEELIRYDMPSYYLYGKPMFHFAACKNHVAIYPGTGTVEEFRDKLTAYKCTKGGVKFKNGEPVPYELIGEIVRYKVWGDKA